MGPQLVRFSKYSGHRVKGMSHEEKICFIRILDIWLKRLFYVIFACVKECLSDMNKILWPKGHSLHTMSTVKRNVYSLGGSEEDGASIHVFALRLGHRARS